MAKGILADLEKIPAQNWNKTEATDDLAYNNIRYCLSAATPQLAHAS